MFVTKKIIRIDIQNIKTRIGNRALIALERKEEQIFYKRYVKGLAMQFVFLNTQLTKLRSPL